MFRPPFFIRIFILGVLGLWASTATAVTQVTATVDKNPAMVDESITLTITADGDADRDAFDPSPLLKDFVVGRTSVSSQTRVVNFNTTRSTTWNTILIPRTQGRFTIPAFNVAGQRTQPINLLIMPVSSAAAGKGRDLFITTEVDSAQVYLQQQIKYTVKLHLAQDLQRGSLAAPTLENAEIRQIGKKDNEYSDIIDGRRYRIIERVFAIIPQQSGSFTIAGPLFEGEVLDNSRQSFGFFNRTKTINRLGPPIDIEVLPIPAGYNTHWLPSEFVQLHEEWQPGAGEYKVGEPITRTLTLTAVGMVEEQLPDIDSQYPAALKTYPDQATTATVDRDRTLIAQRVENIAIIPGQAGEIQIPEVSVPWFNVVTKQTEYATLPARTINVQAAAAQQQNALPATPVSIPPSELADTPQQSQILPIGGTGNNHWWSVSSWALLVLWLLTLLWGIRRKQSAPRQRAAADDEAETAHWQSLNKALQSQDPKTIYPALSSWMGCIAGNTSLALPSSQRKVADMALDKEISLMFAGQYGQQNNNWKSENLARELTRIRKTLLNSGKKGTELRPLYPQ